MRSERQPVVQPIAPRPEQDERPLHPADEPGALVELRARLVRLEQTVATLHATAQVPPADTLDLAETCRRLGLTRSSFYRVELDLRRLGLIEVTRVVRHRRFDAASVERVRLGPRGRSRHRSTMPRSE